MIKQKENDKNIEMGLAGEENILKAIKNLLCIEDHCLDSMSDPEVKNYHRFIRTMRQELVKLFISGKPDAEKWCRLKHGYIVEVCLGEAILKRNQKNQNVDEILGKYKIIKELNDDLWAKIVG